MLLSEQTLSITARAELTIPQLDQMLYLQTEAEPIQQPGHFLFIRISLEMATLLPANTRCIIIPTVIIILLTAVVLFIIISPEISTQLLVTMRFYKIIPVPLIRPSVLHHLTVTKQVRTMWESVP